MKKYLAGALDNNMKIRMINNGTKKYVIVSVTSKNKKWLEHLLEVTSYGNVYDKGRVWEWKIQDQDECKDLLESIEPFLILNRKKIIDTLQFINE